MSQFAWNLIVDTQKSLALLGRLSPQQFMQRYWQKKPLLIRQAVPGFKPLLSRSALFDLAGRDEVESRLVVQALEPSDKDDAWRFARGPFKRRALPALNRRLWTLLVQGVDLHDRAVHQLMQQFRFIPDARLDDLMISYASDGGGVGPHFDSYDVFLMQAQGQRRWRYGRQKDLSLVPDLPLKILANFEPEFDEVLEPGDMLYLPPRYAHDGIAVGECMTYSVGFKVPERQGLGLELAQLLVEALQDDFSDTSAALGAMPPSALYRDPDQPAVATPAAIPATLQQFACDAVDRVLAERKLVPRLLGESLTEPKPQCWFEPGEAPAQLRQVQLAINTRMLYDEDCIYINGESYGAAGRDAKLMRQLADQRCLDAKALAGASAHALDLLREWCESGWAHAE